MKLNRISDLFWQISPNLFFISIILGVITGLCYALLIPFVIFATGADISINTQLSVENYGFFQSPTSDLAKLFLFTCIGIILIKSISTVLSMYIAEKASVEHRSRLYKRINALSYAHLEKIGQARLINLLNIDIPALTNAASMLPFIWINIVTIFGTLGYLIYLNIKVFIFVVICLVVAIITYQLPVFLGVRFFSKARDHYDKVQEGVKGLVYGAKELKLNQGHAEEYISEELLSPEKQAFQGNIKAKSIFVFAEVYGEMISFLVIAVVIFHLPYIYLLTTFELFGIVMALLYLTGPVDVVLKGLQGVQQGKVALNKIKKFND